MSSEQTVLQNSAEIWKFHGNRQIPRLVSKFHSPRNSVGLDHHRFCCGQSSAVILIAQCTQFSPL